jgi:hypothetical protein
MNEVYTARARRAVKSPHADVDALYLIAPCAGPNERKRNSPKGKLVSHLPSRGPEPFDPPEPDDLAPLAPLDAANEEYDIHGADAALNKALGTGNA